MFTTAPDDVCHSAMAHVVTECLDDCKGHSICDTNQMSRGRSSLPRPHATQKMTCVTAEQQSSISETADHHERPSLESMQKNNSRPEGLVRRRNCLHLYHSHARCSPNASLSAKCLVSIYSVSAQVFRTIVTGSVATNFTNQGTP